MEEQYPECINGVLSERPGESCGNRAYVVYVARSGSIVGVDVLILREVRACCQPTKRETRVGARMEDGVLCLYAYVLFIKCKNGVSPKDNKTSLKVGMRHVDLRCISCVKI